MSIYDAFKDALSVAQKSDNIDLYKQLLDLSSQALDLQEEKQRLRSENDEVRKIKIDKNRVERHNAPYITLAGDSDEILYCSRCWDVERKLVQVECKRTGSFRCPNCNNGGVYDEEKRKISSIQTIVI